MFPALKDSMYFLLSYGAMYYNHDEAVICLPISLYPPLHSAFVAVYELLQLDNEKYIAHKKFGTKSYKKDYSIVPTNARDGVHIEHIKTVKPSCVRGVEYLMNRGCLALHTKGPHNVSRFKRAALMTDLINENINRPKQKMKTDDRYAMVHILNLQRNLIPSPLVTRHQIAKMISESKTLFKPVNE